MKKQRKSMSTSYGVPKNFVKAGSLWWWRTGSSSSIGKKAGSERFLIIEKYIDTLAMGNEAGKDSFEFLKIAWQSMSLQKANFAIQVNRIRSAGNNNNFKSIAESSSFQISKFI